MPRSKKKADRLRRNTKEVSGNISTQSRRLIARAASATESDVAVGLWFEAWKTDQKNTDVALYVALALSDMNMQAKAIELLHEFIQINGLSKEILQISGNIALKIEAYDAAEKLFQEAVAFDPQDQNSYLYLLEAQDKAEQYDKGIDLLQNLLPAFPNNAQMWLQLGQLLDHRDGRRGKSVEFYEEALRLAPDDYNVLTAYANVLDIKSDAAELYERALIAKPDGAEAHMGLALWKIAHGKLEEGWQHYEYRFDPSRSAHNAALYQVKAKRWKGQPLKGKKILVMAEQGIGDEVFFAATFSRLSKECEQLFIGCDPRLVSIYQRSFEGAIVGAFDDVISNGQRLRSFPSIQQYLKENRVQLDYSVPLASICMQHWKDISELPCIEEGYLKPDAGLSHEFNVRMKREQKDRLKVGISWQSGKVSKGRGHYYPGLETLLPILILENIDFYVLQYDAEPEIVNKFAAEHNISLTIFEVVDLKSNIEANLAIMDNLDLVIGPPIATQALAQAMGKKIFLLCDGLPWTVFGKTDGSTPVFPKTTAFKKMSNFWSSVIDPVRKELHVMQPEGHPIVQRANGSALTELPDYWLKEFESSPIWEVLHVPIKPELELVLTKFFRKFDCLKVGIVWHDEFNMEDAVPNHTFLDSIIPLLELPNVMFLCLHSDVNRENMPSSLSDLAEKLHFFEDMGLFGKYGKMRAVLDHIDIVIGPCSLVTLYALIKNHTTWLLDTSDAWDLTHEDIAKPLDETSGLWFDFSLDKRHETMLKIQKKLSDNK